MSSEGVRVTRITTPEGKAEWYRQKVERLREALETELPILERLGGSTTPEQATQAAARLRAALHPDEEQP